VYLAAWLGGLWLASAGMQWALSRAPAGRAFGASAAALTTLGVSSAAGDASAAAYVEAVLGVGVLALIIGYLPSMYAAFRPAGGTGHQARDADRAAVGRPGHAWGGWLAGQP
jgi:hypothetical protein